MLNWRQTTCRVPAASVTAEGALPWASVAIGSAPAGAAPQAASVSTASHPA
jgi:hypothetical protein